MIRYSIAFLILIFSLSSNAQDVYKTPSGSKYHLSSCRMVENVSRKLVDANDIVTYGLEPCKICKPPVIQDLGSNSIQDKSVGENESVQCKGITQAGTRCKHKTRLANGFCYQHTEQNSSGTRMRSEIVSVCGARTKSGSYCKRKVKGGGRCYQHQ